MSDARALIKSIFQQRSDAETLARQTAKSRREVGAAIEQGKRQLDKHFLAYISDIAGEIGAHIAPSHRLRVVHQSDFKTLQVDGVCYLGILHMLSLEKKARLISHDAVDCLYLTLTRHLPDGDLQGNDPSLYIGLCVFGKDVSKKHFFQRDSEKNWIGQRGQRLEEYLAVWVINAMQKR